MVKQFLRKKRRLLRGLVNTYMIKRGEVYKDNEWWDKSFYTDGLSDRKTISSKKNAITSNYHYSSLELLLLEHFQNYEIDPSSKSILDIGSGSGHWIDFYSKYNPKTINAIDVSSHSVEFLRKKYNSRMNINIYHGKASEITKLTEEKFDIVNAIGIMFHIVDDNEWENTIHHLSSKLNKNGMLIIGGHFGFLNGINVQIDKNGQINKRLRSKRKWKAILKGNGFSKIYSYKNKAYLYISDTVPENNLLIAVK